MAAEPATLAIVGAGQRGRHVYGEYARRHPDRARVVAVAEPDDGRRAALAAEHRIGPERTFGSWRELVVAGRIADAMIIATPDREHAGPTVAALESGWDVLLEKPIAPTPDGVRRVGEAAGRSRGSVTVAHVLRYTAFFSTVRRVLDEGWLGELVTIEHSESIGYWHFAHSFVRGNWRNERLASPLILAKACHDLDLIRWMAGDRCTGVASFGGLHHFRAEQAPVGAADRCWDGRSRCPVADACPFDAIRLYVDRMEGQAGWPVSVITDDPSPTARMAALADGPYGRCVYRADNDVADHQLVALEFANGVRGTLVVNGLTADNTRTIKLTGTRGELRGRLDTGEIEVRRFLPSGPVPVPGGPWDRDESGRSALRGDEHMVLRAAPAPQLAGDPEAASGGDGHGGGDEGLIDDFVERIRARRDGDDPARLAASRTSLVASLESHLMAFAAERSRHERRVVSL